MCTACVSLFPSVLCKSEWKGEKMKPILDNTSFTYLKFHPKDIFQVKNIQQEPPEWRRYRVCIPNSPALLRNCECQHPSWLCKAPSIGSCWEWGSLRFCTLPWVLLCSDKTPDSLDDTGELWGREFGTYPSPASIPCPQFWPFLLLPGVWWQFNGCLGQVL